MTNLDEILAVGDYGINGNTKAEILKTETNKWFDVLDYPFDQRIQIFKTYFKLKYKFYLLLFCSLSQLKLMCISVMHQSSILVADFMLLVD